MSWYDKFANTWLGRILQGFLLIALAGAVAGILNAVPVNLAFTIGNETVDLNIVWTLVKIFAPVIMIISGLRIMGVKI